MHKVRAACVQSCGTNGLRDLQRVLLSIVGDFNAPLSGEELNAGLQQLGVTVPAGDVRAIFNEFGGSVSLGEFLGVAQDTMNERRRDAVSRAFDALDRDGSGAADLHDLRGRFDAREHGKVLSGESSEDEILNEFLNTFNTRTNPNGKVTREEFEAYYAGLSAEVEDDTYFETLVYNTWQLDDDPPRNKHTTFTVQQLDKTAAFAESRGMLNGTNASTVNRATYRGHVGPPPKRVVGYTGHVPGMLDAHGVSFHQAERTAPVVAKKPTLPQAPPRQ